MFATRRSFTFANSASYSLYIGQNFAESAAFNSMTEPMISAFWSRTLVRSSSMYACTFFFCVSVPGDFATGLWVAGAFGVTCARAAGLVAKSMKSGNHTAIRFFILNPPVRVTPLQRSRLRAYKSRNSLQERWESEYGQRTRKFSQL